MLDKIKKLYSVYKAERLKELSKDLPDPQTGISPAERERLLKYPALKEGEAVFFGENFHFTDSRGFLHSIDEIFGEQIYKFETKNESPYIIDCGANIGLSIYFFKKLYPNAKILAFEPDELTFTLLEKNTLQYGNSVMINKEAVWTEETELTFFTEGSLAGSIVVDFAKKKLTKKVKTIDLKKHLTTPIDFLKIDIEGAENKLIFNLRGHLKNVKNLFLEYHGIIDEEQNLGEILNLLKEAGFQYYIRLAGETMKFPFCGEKPSTFNQQLNIFCYRT